MIQPILPVRPIALPDKAAPAAPSGKAEDFKDLLRTAIHSVEDSRTQATESTGSFLNGENQDVHSVLMDVQRAELMFDLFVQVRNKVTQAYQEIMRMPL